MARITDTVYKPIKAGKWSSEDNYYNSNSQPDYYNTNGQPVHTYTRTIFHYSTAMLTFRIDEDGNPIKGPDTLVDMSLGRGSVSDQQGMNQLFRELGVNLYYRRAGGATIEGMRY